MWQTAINESPATQIQCCPLSTVDYATYISSFAGSRTLSTVPPIRLPPIRTVPCRISSTPEGLLPQQYGEYFSDALQNEIAAQFEVLKTFSMYNVTFEVEDLGQQLYGFTIPGLREHSPRVDLGDVVKIRPLTAVPSQPHFLNQVGNLDLTPRFSGFEFDAIVWGISRPEERIVLRMDGFMPNFSQTCNIIFAFQEHQFAPLWRSIELTANSLNGVKDPSSPWLRQMLFPDKSHAKLQSSLSPGSFELVWFDSQMNFEQQKAVDAVVTANYGCVPYLVCKSSESFPHPKCKPSQ
jgi:helicase MOV-10